MNEGYWSTVLGLRGIPEPAESVMVARDCLLAEYLGLTVHIAHVTSANSVEIVRQGEDILRTKISVLNLDQLRDIVAQYGMDPGKLVMKWKDPKRIMDRIVEIALTRSTKGDAFRSD